MANKKFKHLLNDYINYGLLIAMILLIASGAIAFWSPFSLFNTRLHVLAALMVLALLMAHLFFRKYYFIRGWLKQGSHTKKVFMSVMIGALILIIIALYNFAPVAQLFATSYEQTRNREIVRTNPLTGISINSNELTIVRIGKESNVQLSVNLHFKQQINNDVAVAIWASSTSGSLIETLYVSPNFVYSDNINWFDKKINRAEVLPIWRHKYTLLSGLSPNGELDATTGATISHKFSLNKYLTKEDSEFVINVEINKANDETKNWPSKVIGTPSILYTSLIENSLQDSTYTLVELTGHGGSKNALGKIQYQFNSIDKSMLPLAFGLISITKS